MTQGQEDGRSPPLRSGSGQQASPSALRASQSAVPNANRLAAMLRDYSALSAKEFRRLYPEYPAREIGAERHPVTASLDFFVSYASGIEAATADETRSGSAEGESPAGEAGTPNTGSDQ